MHDIGRLRFSYDNRRQDVEIQGRDDNQVYTSDEIITLGMKCLVKKLGHVNAEQFINSVRASYPDYTLWRRQVFDDLSLDYVIEMARQDAADNPFE